MGIVDNAAAILFLQNKRPEVSTCHVHTGKYSAKTACVGVTVCVGSGPPCLSLPRP